MTVYAIAQLRFIDRAGYDRHQPRFMDVLRHHRGTLLAADESAEVVTGQWDPDKVVLMSFPDEAAFRSWSESPDYQEISKDRRVGADTVVLLAKGPA